MSVDIIIQSRIGSGRLKHKNILSVTKNNLSLIEVVIKRLKKCHLVDKIILATSKKKENDILVKIAKQNKIFFFRGKEIDTLDRFYNAAKKFKTKTIVRITSDCALIDPDLVDKLIKIYKNKKISYLSSTYHLIDEKFVINKKFCYPDGFDVEIFSFDLLEKVQKSFPLKDRMEGGVITPYLRKNKQETKKLKIYVPITNIPNVYQYKLSVDNSEDLRLIREIYNFYYPNIYFNFADVVKFLNLKYKKNKSNNFIYIKKAKKNIMGENMLLSKNHNMILPNQWPTYFSRTNGINVWDLNNKKYVDMGLMGVGTNILGYSNKQVDNSVINTIKKGNLCTLNCPEEVDLSQKLLELHPWFDKVKFARTGGEANAISIRIARSSAKLQNIAICGYHGWHDWYLSANLRNKKNLDKHLLKGLSPLGVPKNLKNTTYTFNYGDFKSLIKLVKLKKIGIIKMEVCRSTKPNISFLRKIRKLCTKKNIILIFDECTTGFRECLGGIHKKIKIYPDLLILGKTLGNGYAITAVLGKKKLMENSSKSFISSTFWTERIGPTAALKTLEVMEKIKPWKKVNFIGEKMMEIWKSVAKKNKIKIKVFGIPTLAKFIFLEKNNEYKTFLTQEFLKKNILATTSFYPSYAHNLNDLLKYKIILDKIFKKIKYFQKNNTPSFNFLNDEISGNPFSRLN